MKNVAILASLTALVAIPLLTADVEAAGVGALAAAVCTPTNGTPAWGWDALYNSSTTAAMSADCSLPGAFSGYVDEHYVDWAYITLVDRHASASVSCMLKVVDTDGNINFTSSTFNSYNSETATFGFAAAAEGFAYFACTVPKATGTSSANRSGIRGIYVYN